LKGRLCTECNARLGRTLDQELIRTGHTGMTRQLLGISGRSGQPSANVFEYKAAQLEKPIEAESASIVPGQLIPIQAVGRNPDGTLKSVQQRTLTIATTEAGMLTLGYAIAIVAFIRVGEKLLQTFGPRKPMIWGSLIVGLSIAMLMPTNLLIGQYTMLAVAAYTLFGLGLAFYATPSTDAALSNLPDDQAGSGSGIYKMASSLGASFGVAISAAIFTALSVGTESTRWLEGVITFAGRQDNLAVRQAALVALAFNLLMVVAAIVSIMLTVPMGQKAGESR
jgi:MFS family permease